jgi:hydrogenase-4 component F
MTVLFMVVMNVGILMTNHFILLWVLIEISTLCAAPLVALGDSPSPKLTAWRYVLYSAMSWPLPSSASCA